MFDVFTFRICSGLTCPAYGMQVDEKAVRLHRPDLRHVRIVSGTGPGNAPEDARLRFDRESFSKAAKLASLVLDTPGTTTLTQDCFVGLRTLVKLELKACGLVSISKALTSLAGCLTKLALPLNNRLQLADSDIATLPTLRKLRKLDVRKSSLKNALTTADTAAAAAAVTLTYEPPLWSLRSLQHLVSVPNAFLAHHGHALSLLVHE